MTKTSKTSKSLKAAQDRVKKAGGQVSISRLRLDKAKNELRRAKADLEAMSK